MPDGVASYIPADGVNNPNTMRVMGFGSVNPPKATSMVGLDLDHDDEFRVTHLTRGDGGEDLLR